MLLGVYLGQYCINVLTYFFVTWFPIYLVKERGLNILEAGFAAAAPALCGFIGGVLGGYGSDWLLKRTGSLTIARKTPLLIGMLLATLIIACVYIEQEWLVVVVMAVAFFGKGIASLGWAVISDVSPASARRSHRRRVQHVRQQCRHRDAHRDRLHRRGHRFVRRRVDLRRPHCLLTIFAYFVIVGPIRRLELQ